MAEQKQSDDDENRGFHISPHEITFDRNRDKLITATFGPEANKIHFDPATGQYKIVLYMKSSYSNHYSYLGFTEKVLQIIPNETHRRQVMERVSWIRPFTDKTDRAYAAIVSLDFGRDEVTVMLGIFQILKLYLTDNAKCGDIIGRHSENRLHFKPFQSGHYPYHWKVLGIPLNMVAVDVRDIANSKAVNQVIQETFHLALNAFRWSRVVDDASLKFKAAIMMDTTTTCPELENGPRRFELPMTLNGITRKGMRIKVTRIHRSAQKLPADFASNNVPRMDKLDSALAAIELNPETQNVEQGLNEVDEDVDDLMNQQAVPPSGKGKGSHSQ